MIAKMVWIHAGLVALFAGGVAVGVLCHHHMRPAGHGPQHHGRQHHAGQDVGPFVDHFRKRLDLSEEQTAKVKETLQGMHKELTDMARGFHEKFKTSRARAWADIRGLLSEKQRAEFEKLVEDLELHHPGGH